MAMVRQLTEDEIVNGSTPEEENRSSIPVERSNSRPPSRSRSSSGSRRNTPVMPSLQYSKEDLIKYSTTPLSKSWPSCLDPAFNNPTGKWDPERWFLGSRNDRPPQPDDFRPKRPDEGAVGSKRKSSDPKERIKEEKDDIVLSPQRRSFGTGCHVIPQSSLARRPGSPTDGRETDSFREPSRRIGSGRLMRDQRDWEQEYGYNNRGDRRDRFNQDESDKDMRRYSGGRYNRNDRRSNRNRIDEVEPEWFSGGPTSQSETIELVGFEDPHNDGEGRKAKKKRSKQNSRRSSLKSDEGEKVEMVSSDEKPSQKKAESKPEDSKKSIREVKETEGPQDAKPANSSFDLEELFKMDWIPGLLPNETPPESANKDMGCSRFSQWFRKDSPLHDMPGSESNSRRSSLHEELLANVLGIVEPQVMIPSPTQNTSSTFFAPISPALSQGSGYALPQTMPNTTSKDIMEMLQNANSNKEVNGRPPKESMRTVRELEADLKRIVLGGENKKQSEEKSAFDKLLQHMSDSNNSHTAPLSMGPLDKSKALQEQDLLQDMLSAPRRSPVQQQFQMFDEKHPIFKVSQGMHPQFQQQNQNSQNDAFANLMHQKQHEQHLQQMQEHEQQMRMHQQKMKQQQHLQQQQQQMQQQSQQQAQNAPMQGFTVDMLAKLLCPTTQAPVSPASPGFQTASAQSMNNTALQYQRQRELLSSLLKQQHNIPQPNILQAMQQQQQNQQQRRCPSAKDMPVQQTLGLPTLGISPRQSPLPPEVLGSAIPNQGRIPSPLVFGQQPPALSHAPAPIHPAALAQAMNSVSPNTLQVQNPVVLQRVPSPQELAVHTQSILQNALIKRKLEEQKENFRKRQEAQRTNSPVPPNKNGTSSPLKGVSPTIAFTPTSVMRKIQSEKTENKDQKTIQQQNGNAYFGTTDPRMADNAQAYQKMNALAMHNMGIPTTIDTNFASPNIFTNSQNASLLTTAPRAVHGHGMPQSRSVMSGMNSVGQPMQMHQSQGRPIVKVGLGQAGADNARTGMPISKATVTHKQFNNQALDVDPTYTWQSQVARQQQQQMPPQQQLQMAATYAALNRPPPALNHPSLMRPPTPSYPPLLRNAPQNPIRAQTSSMNQLNHLNQLAAMQQMQQRGAMDSRQLQALAQSQRIHPTTLQHLLMNSQNPVAAAAQAGFSVNRDGKHQHLLPGQPGTNRQSPVNLAKWFGNDVLKQKMPDMPPSNQQKALLVEDVERQQQTVHN